MASVDPTEIHPEYDRPTPETIDEWSSEQLEAYNEAKDAELTAEAEQSKAEMAREEKATLEFLKSTTQEESDLHTETLNIGEELGASDDVFVTVKTKLSGELESKFDAITDEQGKDLPRIANIKDAIVDAICMLIVDDDESGKYDFQSRAVWEAYYYEEGSEGILRVFNAVAGPALERYDDLGNSRGRGRQ